MTPTIPPPPRTPDLRIHAQGAGWSVAVPTAIVVALISLVGQWLMRPTPEAHASPSDPATREDIRELRSDVKQILSRLGAVEDAVKNDAVVRGARP